MSARQLSIRRARPEDVREIEALQHEAMRRLASADYSPAQIEGGLRFIGPLDRQLIADGTYYVAEVDGELAGCGGWSYRAAIHGTSRAAGGGPEAIELDPETDAARIRAVFVRPDWARRGIGRMLVETAEAAAHTAGFGAFELVATLTGKPLYTALGYRVVKRLAVPLPDGTELAAVHMLKRLP